MVKASRIAIVILAIVTVTGCASSGLSGTNYSRSEARKVQSVRYGTVQSVVPVIIDGRTDGIVGAGTGAVVGGIAGSTIGGGKGRTLATVVGTVAGGLAGQAIEKNVTTKQGQEITVRMESGEVLSIVQEVENNQYFRSGDRVRLLRQGGTSRLSY